MQRLLHGVLGVWFLIAMSMAQGCMVPAQSSNPSRDAIINSGANNSVSSPSAPIRTAQSNVPINTKNFVPDPGASSALTDHFKHNRLPLVGAQVLRNPSTGDRAVVLYGFVGSDLGKSDAQRQADDFINDASVDVDNRIRVNPDLLTARGSSSDSSPDTLYTRDPSPPPDAQANAAPSMPGVQSYVDQQNQSAQIQQYQQQNAMGNMSSMVPLIALLGMLSAGMASGNGSYATGPRYSPYGYSSPYGNSPFPSYGGYPPGMAPPTFGTPGYGFGASPGFGGSMGGGVTPFGSLPGSPYYYHP